MFIKYYSSIYNINAALKIFVTDPYDSDGKQEQAINFSFLEQNRDKIEEKRIVIVKSENSVQFQNILDYIDKNTLATRN